MRDEGNAANIPMLPVGYYDLGFFPLGNEIVKVVFTPNRGEGSFIQAGGLRFAQIFFGEPMSEVLPRWTILQHEALEFLLIQKGVSFDPTDLLTPDVSNRMFVLTHAQMNRVAVDLALFMKEFFEKGERNSPVKFR